MPVSPMLSAGGLLRPHAGHRGCSYPGIPSCKQHQHAAGLQSRASQQARCLFVSQPVLDAPRQRRCQPASWSSPNNIQYRRRRGLLRRQTGSRQVTTMGGAPSGPFTPLVVLVRNQIGTKSFNQLRGKAISLHSQVIKSFGKQIGADAKQTQGLIRLAKQNGSKLGFLS